MPGRRWRRYPRPETTSTTPDSRCTGVGARAQTTRTPCSGTCWTPGQWTRMGTGIRPRLHGGRWRFCRKSLSGKKAVRCRETAGGPIMIRVEPLEAGYLVVDEDRKSVVEGSGVEPG